MNITQSIGLCFFFQAPRPLSQKDLENVLATSRHTKVAANEYYTGLNLPSSPRLSRNRDSVEIPAQAAINELSRLVVSQILNIQTDPQDP